jgi:hypothetical protein
MIQVIKCKCGSIFAASKVPECYQDKEWLKNLRKYSLDSCNVEIIENDKSIQFEKCECGMKEKNSLPNQLNLF